MAQLKQNKGKKQGLKGCGWNVKLATLHEFWILWHVLQVQQQKEVKREMILKIAPMLKGSIKISVSEKKSTHLNCKLKSFLLDSIS